MPGFWLEGYEASCEAAKKELDTNLAKLREQLSAASTPAERKELGDAIRRLSEQFERRLADLKRSLF